MQKNDRDKTRLAPPHTETGWDWAAHRENQWDGSVDDVLGVE